MCPSAWATTKSLWWQPAEHIVFIIGYIHTYYAHLASMRFEHSVRRWSLKNTYITNINVSISNFVIFFIFFPVNRANHCRTQTRNRKLSLSHIYPKWWLVLILLKSKRRNNHNVHSDRLSFITKKLPWSIDKQLSVFSSSKSIFHETEPYCE